MQCEEKEDDMVSMDIAASYINARGQLQAIPDTIQQQLFDAMGGNAPHLKKSALPLPTVKVVLQNDDIELIIKGKGEFYWQLETEDKALLQQGQIVSGKVLVLPTDLPLGYHRLTLNQRGEQWNCCVIVAPKRCYIPSAIENDQKLWGANVQLYTLRSEQNWGIGDFGDLKRMISEVSSRGGSFIGLNPIHSLFPSTPESASPYSPSSRCWLNIIYIDVESVADFKLSEEGRYWWQSKATQESLVAARNSESVDYTAVTQLKLTALRFAWQHFSLRNKQDPLQVEFKQFVEKRGLSLNWQARFDALHADLMEQNTAHWGWPVWPEEYQNAHSSSVTQFCETKHDQVKFWSWLQWLAWRQFADCWQQCTEFNMPIGLYRDLAVGVTQGGVETWHDRDLYCVEASVGAPPDILGPLGQNWGIAPLNPHVLVERAYAPFIDLLRTNMENCGALRIDHVMSLLRLWWVPQGEAAANGAYVRYPVDDLLAILALESQRMRCMVIGEDLGIVPEEIISKLRDCGIFSYKVLWFEHDAQSKLFPPEQWSAQAMAVITTHDLPTLRGYWESHDLTLGQKLGLYPDTEILEGLRTDREKAKQQLFDALTVRENHQGVNNEVLIVGKMSVELNHKLHYLVADSNCDLLGLQPEDWLEMLEPVNIPGTSTGYANWRRKLSKTLEDIFADPQVNSLIEEVDRRRKQLSHQQN